MTDDQIERQAERMMDMLDVRFLGTNMTRAMYDHEVDRIEAWVREQYAARRVAA